MHGTYLFEVTCKDPAANAQTRSLSEDLKHSGFRGVRVQSVSQLYRLIGELTPEERRRVAEALLCDPVVQVCHDGGWRSDSSSHGKKPVRAKNVVVDVWYKAGVTDVVGESVLKGLKDLNILGVTEARAGTRYHLGGMANPAIVEKSALTLWVNPLVQDRFIYAG